MEGFPTTPRADPNSALVSRGSKWILKEKLFNIQQLLQCRSKYYETNLWHPYSSRVFEQYQECNKRRCGLGDLNVINNQNKQTTFLYKTTFFKPWSFGPLICISIHAEQASDSLIYGSLPIDMIFFLWQIFAQLQQFI